MKKTLIALVSLFMGAACGAQEYTTQQNAEFTATIATPGVQLVDVRTSGEYAAGHIPDAVNIDIQRPDFDRHIAALDKSRPVAVYCRSGVRSRKAAQRLVAQGFTVYNLAGGILGWDGPTCR